MPTYTAGNLITQALLVLGVLASGEQPESVEMGDSLIALNLMIDSWNTESLAVYGTMDQVFTWPAGQVTQTLGPAGDFVGVCPVQLGEGTYFVLEGNSYPLKIINREQYSSITVKTITTQIPNLIFPNMTVPLAAAGLLEMSLYPVPSQDLEFHFISLVEIAEVLSDADTVYVPRGYYEAYIYNLAVRLASQYGVSPSREVKQLASKSRTNIKRINNPDTVMVTPLPVGWNARYNIVTDGY